VLVVEDDDTIRRMLLTTVAEEGGRPVVAARDGDEALARAREQRPSVVILDLLLPGLDGYTVARRLRADPATAGCWIIAVTAGGRAEEALGAGCDQFLWKPLRVEELLLAVEAGLARTVG
jgi:CheY-like chemotaxis protein